MKSYWSPSAWEADAKAAGAKISVKQLKTYNKATAIKGKKIIGTFFYPTDLSRCRIAIGGNLDL